MTRLLRSISIHAAMVTVLACFVVFLAAVAIMGQVASHSANNTLETLDRVNVLREQMVGPAETQESTLTEFVRYADEHGEMMLADYDAMSTLFQRIQIGILVIVTLMVAMIYMGLRRIVITPLQVAVETLEAIAKADLSREIRVYGRNEISKLFAAMRDMQQNLTRIVTDVRDSSGSLHVGSREIASGNADLSSRTEQQAASLEETASSMEELTTTVKQNADNARQASGLALDASSTAEDRGYHRSHRLDRFPDKHPGIECLGGGGTSR